MEWTCRKRVWLQGQVQSPSHGIRFKKNPRTNNLISVRGVTSMGEQITTDSHNPTVLNKIRGSWTMFVLCPLIGDQMVFTKELACRFPVYSLIFGYITLPKSRRRHVNDYCPLWLKPPELT